MSSEKTVSGVIRIRGMFCTHCEETVRKALLSLPGVKDAAVSYEKETAFVTYDPALVDEEKLRQSIRDAGYEPVEAEKPRLQILGILILLLALWLAAKHFGWTKIFTFFPEIDTSAHIGMLFLIGILTSVHCIAMCGGINLTQSVIASASREKLLKSNALYHAGRILSYTLIGCLVGGIGEALTISTTAKGWIMVIAGCAILLMSLNMLGVFKLLRKLRLPGMGKLYTRLRLRYRTGSSFVIGLLNGLMPCGPLQSMQIYALSTGSMIRGGLSMLAFCLGTIPLMFGFGLIAGKLNRKYRRVMLIVSALLIFVMALNMMSSGISLFGKSLQPARSNAAATAVQGERVQTLRTEIDYGSYPAVQIKAGVPLIWTIVVPEGKLTGCNGEIIIPALDIDLVLHEGENTLEFTAEEPGTIAYSCWMGMIKSSIEVVE